MKNYILISLTILFTLGCGTSGITHYAEESYKSTPTVHIDGKLAVFAMMAAGSSSLNNATPPVKIPDAPYTPSVDIKGSKRILPGDNSMEGFRNQANDILLAKFKQNRRNVTIIPPKQVQGIINQAQLTTPYLDFLGTYNYLSTSPEFLKKLGSYLNCKYLLVPQLVVISNMNHNILTFIVSWGEKYSDYSVTILGQVWDLSTGELIWSGRGTSSTIVTTYKKSPGFDQLAAKASERLISILP